MTESQDNNDPIQINDQNMQRLNTIASILGMTTVFLFLITLLIVFYFPYFYSQPPANTKLPNTPTRTPTLTQAPTQTLTPPATFTLTLEPTSTATFASTPTPHPAQGFADPILTAVANVKPLFDDDFSKNRGWVWESAIYDQIKIKDGVVNVNGKGHLWPPNPHTFAVCKNLVVEFDILPMLNTTKMGITFRREDAGSYNFDIGVDGAWNFYRYKGFWKELQAGKSYRVVLVARGEEFALFMDGSPVFYIVDSDYSKASDLMLTYDGQGQFDNFKLWDLDQVRGLP